jgi:hypothetical protein
VKHPHQRDTKETPKRRWCHCKEEKLQTPLLVSVVQRSSVEKRSLLIFQLRVTRARRAMNARHPGWCQKCRSKYAVSTRIKYTQTWGWVHEKCHQHPLAHKPIIT